MSQTVTVNVHNPIVRSINRIESTTTLALTLSNNEYHGMVDLFFADDAELDAFLASVSDARPYSAEDEPENYTCSYCKRPELDCSRDACAGVKKDRER